MICEVKSGIPVPPHGRKGNKTPYLYPWNKMQVGDSFAVYPTKGRSVAAVANSVRAAGHHWAKPFPGMAFTCRIIHDAAGDHVRIWRAVVTRARLIATAVILVAFGALGLGWMVLKAQEVQW